MTVHNADVTLTVATTCPINVASTAIYLTSKHHTILNVILEKRKKKHYLEMQFIGKLYLNLLIVYGF